MNVGIVLETAPTARLMGRIFPDPNTRIFDAQERSNAIMGIGSLAAKDMAGVLVLDSDTLEERMLTELQLEIGALVRMGNAAYPRRLVLAIPQVEAVLFADRAGLEKALAKKITDDEAFEARFRPKAVFYRLLGKQNATERAIAVIDRLSDDTLRRMAEHPVIQEIRQFIDEVRHESDEPAKVRRAS